MFERDDSEAATNGTGKAIDERVLLSDRHIVGFST